MIIAFSGRKNSGKSTLSRILQKKGFIKISFAMELKSLISKLYDIPLEYLFDQIKKEEKLLTPLKWDKLKASELAKLIGSEDCLENKEKLFFNYRSALQHIGTEVLGKYDNDFHVKNLSKYIDKNKNYVLDDVRFKNELIFLKKLKAICVYVIRPYYFDDYSNHKSEIDVNRKDFEYVILNNRNEKHLISKFLKFESFLFQKYHKFNMSRKNFKTLLLKYDFDTSKIAKELNCSTDKIVWWCSKYCIPFLRNNFKLNHDCFLSINKKSSYFAGLLSADGCVKKTPKKYNYVVELSSDDIFLNKSFNKFIGTSKKSYHKKRKNGKIGYLSIVNSPFIVDDMKLWNIEPRKSKHNKIPDCIKGDDELLKTWVIGLIDGDGSIFFHNNHLVINILASKEIIEYIQHKFSDIQVNMVQEKKIENLYNLKFWGKKAMQFYNHIYVEGFGLPRKWKKAKMCNEDGKLLKKII